MDRLPVEILTKVFDFVPRDKLPKCMGVNRQWYDIISTNYTFYSCMVTTDGEMNTLECNNNVRCRSDCMLFGNFVTINDIVYFCRLRFSRLRIYNFHLEEWPGPWTLYNEPRKNEYSIEELLALHKDSLEELLIFQNNEHRDSHKFITKFRDLVRSIGFKKHVKLSFITVDTIRYENETEKPPFDHRCRPE